MTPSYRSRWLTGCWLEIVGFAGWCGESTLVTLPKLQKPETQPQHFFPYFWQDSRRSSSTASARSRSITSKWMSRSVTTSLNRQTSSSSRVMNSHVPPGTWLSFAAYVVISLQILEMQHYMTVFYINIFRYTLMLYVCMLFSFGSREPR